MPVVAAEPAVKMEADEVSCYNFLFYLNTSIHCTEGYLLCKILWNIMGGGGGVSRLGKKLR